MATYTDKRSDSFITKLQIFIFTKAFEGKITSYIKNNNEIIKEFKLFKLDQEIANIYSSEYYQNDENVDISYNNITIKSSKLLDNLMDGKNYIISKANIKEYFNEIFDELKKVYNDNYENIFTLAEFNEMIKNKQCTYCGITKDTIKKLGRKKQLHNKRSETRGYTLEVDRMSPNLEYTADNCCMSCYWCNNAKTDEYLPSEFKEIARGINNVWNQRLKKADIDEKVIFPEESLIWTKEPK